MAFKCEQRIGSPEASHDDPSLTDSGHHGLSLEYLSGVCDFWISSTLEDVLSLNDLGEPITT